MSQYAVGTVDVTNGSAAIVGNGTAWQTAGILAGDLFVIIGEGVVYEISGITGEGAGTLTVNYAGPTAAAVPYIMARDFTPLISLPYPQQGDVETAAILRRALQELEGHLVGEAWHLVGSGGGEPAFQADWVNAGGALEDVRFRRLPTMTTGQQGARVYLEGAATSATETAPSILFQLPAGYRPGADMHFPIINGTTLVVVVVKSTGDVEVQSGTLTDAVHLEGIVFRQEA